MTERATFAAGCFWGVESTFRALPGVTGTRVGYTGGHADNPSYHDVCSDTTHHAEAVEIEFDPDQVSYEQLLDLFWRSHDPTLGQVADKARRGQGQYRSAIFFHTPEQEQQARGSLADAEAQLDNPAGTDIATEIVPATTFYEAEEYHQQYNEKHGWTTS